jgi:protein arginine kinase
MMMERNYITQQFSLHGHKAAVLGPEHAVSGMINEIDHLRLACLKGGLSLDQCWDILDELDTKLEETLDYAVSLEWGYLSAEVANAGTGMRASVMLHLPALVRTSIIEKAMKAVVQVGMTVKGFFGNDENSLGDLYQVSNQLGLGFSETDLIEKLDAIASQLVHYERKAREELLENERFELEDEVMRALGILTHCRMLTANEAISLLALLRFGAATSIISAPLERITAMLFLTQKAHIQYLIDSKEASADTRVIDHTRADVIRQVLNRCL